MNIYLEAYGCTANKADASLIMGILKKNKYSTLTGKIAYTLIIIALVIERIYLVFFKILSKEKKTNRYPVKYVMPPILS